jgi:redox-sensing transcriptional repressor
MKIKAIASGASVKSIRRLSVYRRILSRLIETGVQTVRSHDLAESAGVTAAQVRRDFMALGYRGSPNRGYSCRDLFASIGEFMGTDVPVKAVLVGVGNLGRAILGYFDTRDVNIKIVACFDIDHAIIGSEINHCYCYPQDNLERILRRRPVPIGIIAVPFRHAQEVADRLIAAGVRGIMNFAPATLRVPESIYVEDMDFTASLETISFYASHGVFAHQD